MPPRNPFVSVAGARPEIIAYGLRNPWRFWIDPTLNEMVIGDVGEGTREEIDVLPLDNSAPTSAGPARKATRSRRCSDPQLLQDRHVDAAGVGVPAPATRCSITGGVVVRDPRSQARGRFLWADLCDSRSTRSTRASRPSEIDLGLNASSRRASARTPAGDVYVATVGGSVYRIDPR